MPIFTLDQLRALAASYATLQERLDASATAYASFPYKTPPGRQYANYGIQCSIREWPVNVDCVEKLQN